MLQGAVPGGRRITITDVDRRCVDHALCPTCRLFRHHDTPTSVGGITVALGSCCARCQLATTVAGNPHARSNIYARCTRIRSAAEEGMALHGGPRSAPRPECTR